MAKDNINEEYQKAVRKRNYVPVPNPEYPANSAQVIERAKKADIAAQQKERMDNILSAVRYGSLFGAEGTEDNSDYSVHDRLTSGKKGALHRKEKALQESQANAKKGTVVETEDNAKVGLKNPSVRKDDTTIKPTETGNNKVLYTVSPSSINKTTDIQDKKFNENPADQRRRLSNIEKKEKAIAEHAKAKENEKERIQQEKENRADLHSAREKSRASAKDYKNENKTDFVTMPALMEYYKNNDFTPNIKRGIKEYLTGEDTVFSRRAKELLDDINNKSTALSPIEQGFIDLWNSYEEEGLNKEKYAEDMSELHGKRLDAWKNRKGASRTVTEDRNALSKAIAQFNKENKERTANLEAVGTDGSTYGIRVSGKGANASYILKVVKDPKTGQKILRAWPAQKNETSGDTWLETHTVDESRGSIGKGYPFNTEAEKNSAIMTFMQGFAGNTGKVKGNFGDDKRADVMQADAYSTAMRLHGKNAYDEIKRLREERGKEVNVANILKLWAQLGIQVDANTLDMYYTGEHPDSRALSDKLAGSEKQGKFELPAGFVPLKVGKSKEQKEAEYQESLQKLVGKINKTVENSVERVEKAYKRLKKELPGADATDEERERDAKQRANAEEIIAKAKHYFKTVVNEDGSVTTVPVKVLKSENKRGFYASGKGSKAHFTENLNTGKKHQDSGSAQGNIDWSDKEKTKKAAEAQTKKYTGELKDRPKNSEDPTHVSKNILNAIRSGRVDLGALL